jgi:hypothetical protein
MISKSCNENPKEDFYSRNMRWKEKVDNFKQKQHLLNEKKEYEECFFRPTLISNLSSSNIHNKEIRGGDYIYNKNIEWLRKVNENKIKMNLEQQEEIKTKGKFEKSKPRMIKNVISRISELKCTPTELLSEEESLKKDLTTTIQTPTNNISTNRSNLFSCKSNRSGPVLLKELNTNATQNNNSTLTKNNVDELIKEIKGIIESLKVTLEENKVLNSQIDKNTTIEELHSNRNTYGSLVNIGSPTSKNEKRLKTSKSVDKVNNIYII